MNRTALSLLLAGTLALASCGQTPVPQPDAAAQTTEAAADNAQATRTLAAAAADCSIVTNQSAYCYDSAPGTQYRYVVKCYDDGIANRFIWDYGAWRNQSGTYRSNASCPAGDVFHSHYIDFR